MTSQQNLLCHAFAFLSSSNAKILKHSWPISRTSVIICYLCLDLPALLSYGRSLHPGKANHGFVIDPTVCFSCGFNLSRTIKHNCQVKIKSECSYFSNSHQQSLKMQDLLEQGPVLVLVCIYPLYNLHLVLTRINITCFRDYENNKIQRKVLNLNIKC